MNAVAGPSSLESRMAVALAQHGWQVSDVLLPGLSIAFRVYDTVCGPNRALARFNDYGPHCENLVLTGEYYSEGGNVLATTLLLVPREPTDALIRDVATRFATEAHRLIEESYGVRIRRQLSADARGRAQSADEPRSEDTAPSARPTAPGVRVRRRAPR